MTSPHVQEIFFIQRNENVNPLGLTDDIMLKNGKQVSKIVVLLSFTQVVPILQFHTTTTIMPTSLLFRVVILMLAVGLLTSCGEQSISSYPVENQEFVLEGPLFQGPNTAQATFSPAIEAEGELVGATLKTATLSVPAGQNFDAFSDVVLQLVTGSSDMIQVGVLNPVPKGASELTLQVSSEADLTELLNSESCVWVIDANMPVDMMDTTITFMGDFAFDLTHSK